MKRILVITVLAVLLTSTAGATAAMAAPAGNAHVRQFDVTTGDVSGKLTINPTAQTYVFNAVGGMPGQIYYLFISVVPDSNDLIGSAAADADGNIHMTGQCTATVAELDDEKTPPMIMITPLVGGYQEIGAMSLLNGGWFVAKLACYYSTDNGATWTESGHTAGIGLSGSVHTDLGSLGVPDGALVKIHVIVVAGKDRTGSEIFQYTPIAPSGIYWNAYYEIVGTTGNPALYYDGCSQIGNHPI